MLLTRLSHTLRRLRDEEHGAGMAAVMGLLAVSLVTTAIVAASIVQATTYTTVSRANVQSQAAAEAGVAVARAGLLKGTCAANSSRYASAEGEVPAYIATVWLPSGGSWVRGCPGPGAATQVRILSTGYAENPGVQGATGGDTTHIEVILSSAQSSAEITASGPAVYAYNSQGFGGGGRLVTLDGGETSIMIREGNVTCTGGAAGAADIVVNNGNLTVSNGCSITGDAFASGRVTLPGGPNVGGSVIANALTITGGSKVLGSAWVHQDVTLEGGVEIRGNVTAASMSFSNGGTIGGNVQTTGNVVFNGGGGPLIKGNLTAANFSTGNGGEVVKNAWIYGSTSLNWGAIIRGNLTTKTWSKPGGSNTDFVKGTVTVVAGGPTASPYATNAARPAWPVVPDWINFPYRPSDWSGFAVTQIASTGACTYAQVRAAIEGFGGQNGIVDAQGCVGGVVIGSDHIVTLTSDVAIFAKSYNLGEGGGFTASSVRKLWLLTPDNTVESPPVPSCVTGENSFSITGGFTFSDKLRVMLYTPCKIALGSSTKFTGQVFAGKAGIDGGAQLTYTAVGLPGYNLDTGLATGSTPTEAERTVVSYRDVQEGN